MSSASVGPPFRVFAGPPKRGHADSVDSTRVVSQVGQPKKRGHTELKGLIEPAGHVFSERSTTFFGFAGPPKRGDADPLIQQGLLAKLRWRGESACSI